MTHDGARLSLEGWALSSPINTAAAPVLGGVWTAAVASESGLGRGIGRSMYNNDSMAAASR